MTWIGRGKVVAGQIVLNESPPMPEGAEVEVQLESRDAAATPQSPSSIKELMSLPFFGMWADREDMADSAAWVRKEREKWHQRIQRPD